MYIPSAATMKFLFAIIICMLSSRAGAQAKLLSLKDFDQRLANGKDTTFVVNFWATWCAPCVQELPYFERLRKENKALPLQVLLISVDSRSKLEKLVTPFIKTHQIESEVYIFDEPDQQKFIDHVDKNWSGSVPATLVVNTASSRRSFHEREFSYEELKSLTINPK